jgi:hypothetical protein
VKPKGENSKKKRPRSVASCFLKEGKSFPWLGCLDGMRQRDMLSSDQSLASLLLLCSVSCWGHASAGFVSCPTTLVPTPSPPSPSPSPSPLVVFLEARLPLACQEICSNHSSSWRVTDRRRPRDWLYEAEVSLEALHNLNKNSSSSLSQLLTCRQGLQDLWQATDALHTALQHMPYPLFQPLLQRV